MPDMHSGLVAHIQRFSLHDGPGIRTTVFLKGCPLGCLWCHNPENRSSQPEVMVVESRCVRCGRCDPVCPSHSADAPSAVDHQPAVVCLLCGACVKACPAGARQMVGRQMTVSEVLDEIRRDTIFYDDSQGGVTFSGGEPLAQPAFLEALLAACTAEGIHTAVDTCGFAPTEQILAMAARADLILYDLKVLDDEKHTRLTGVSNALIVDNLCTLQRVHNNIWLRIPIIPGLNDAEEDLEALRRLAAGLHAVRQINLLPYHQTAGHKFQSLGLPYELSDIRPPSSQFMEHTLARFRDSGLTTRIGG
jgi:pyruvate formate lyase activating enzyme